MQIKRDAEGLIEVLAFTRKVLQERRQPNIKYQKYRKQPRSKNYSVSGTVKCQSVLDKLKRLYGDDEETLLYQLDRYLKVLKQFVDRFGKGPVILMRVPSRICIIGGHTDYLTDPRRYLLGHVLTFANPRRDMLIAIRSNEKGAFRLSSTDKHFKDKRFDISDFSREVKELSVSRPGDDEKTKANRQVLRNIIVSDSKKFWLAYLDLLQMERKAKRKPEHSSKHWENYVKASVYWYLVRKAHKQKRPLSETSLNGFDMVVSSDIPVSGGSSSSSALVVASHIAVRLAENGQEIDSRFRMETARHTPLGEWFVGTRGGSMDQATIALGEANTALRMSFGPFEMEKIPIPTTRKSAVRRTPFRAASEGYKWVTIYTHPHGGGSQIETGYNERSAASFYIIKECIDEALKKKPQLRRKWEKIKRAAKEKDLGGLERYTPDMERILDLLPDYVTLAQIRRFVPARVYKEMESRYGALFSLPPQKRIKVKKWALHHFEEIRRIFRTAKLLKEAYEAERGGDRRTVDRKMKEAGKNITESGRSLRDNYELSTPDLNRVIDIALAIKGVLGAYIHGGGFGGSALVLVREDSIEDLIKKETEKYYRKRRRGHKEPTRDDIIVSDPGEGLSLVDL